MNKLFLGILFLAAFFVFTAAENPGNDLSYRKIEAHEMVHVLNSFSDFSELFTEKVSVRVLSVYDEAANYTEGCDKNSYLYIAVSNFDLCPTQAVFKIASLQGPKFIKWIKDDPHNPILQFEYGPYYKRKIATVKVSLQGLTFLKTSS
jgi:hypothetical protein